MFSPLVPPARLTLALLALAVAAPAPSWAGFTSPTLVLSAAEGEGTGGRRAAAFEGSFDFPNAVQVGYPLNLVVFQGSTFVRYPAAGAPVTGTSPAVADGALDESELDAFVAQGAAADASVRLLTMTPTAIRVSLPQSFAAGLATGVLFTILPDGSVVSNAIDVVLP